jgi:hypothetical protein
MFNGMSHHKILQSQRKVHPNAKRMGNAKQNADKEAIAVNHDFNQVTPPKKFRSSPVRK